MKFEFSQNLIDFLLEVKTTSTSITEEEHLYHFEKVSFVTNEFTCAVFLKFSNKLEKEEIFREIEMILNKTGHPSNTDIVTTLLLLFCLARNNRNIDLINRFFSLIGTCRLKQYMFFAAKQEEKIFQLNFNDFTIGDLDYAKFSDFIRTHSTSDYAEKYKSILLNKAGIQIKQREVQIVNF